MDKTDAAEWWAEVRKIAPILVPSNHFHGWMFAHKSLIELDAPSFRFKGERCCRFKTGEVFYGRSGESDIDHWTDPEEETALKFAEEFMYNPRWVEDIKDISGLREFHYEAEIRAKVASTCPKFWRGVLAREAADRAKAVDIREAKESMEARMNEVVEAIQIAG